MKINEHILRKIIREALNEMVAYHGGARKFGTFDLSKAHTGEGGTMYGYGVYVTTNPNTAKYYMNISARGQGAGYLYEVQIPDDNGRNYLNIEKNRPQTYDYLMNGLSKLYPNFAGDIANCLEYCKEYDTLMWMFQSGCEYAFDEKELANALQRLGYIGVRVPVGYQDAGMGQTEGYNYTIFSDKNVKVINVRQLPVQKQQVAENRIMKVVTKSVRKALSEEGIHIKKKNRGKFNATKERTGKSTEELTRSKNPLTRKRAIFAQNAKKWNKKK